MRVYYITNIQGNSCELHTRTKGYCKTVDISDLDELSKTNIILGYNKLTKGVQAKQGSDVLKHINARRKLAGLEAIPDTSYGFNKESTTFDISNNTAHTNRSFVIANGLTLNLHYLNSIENVKYNKADNSIALTITDKGIYDFEVTDVFDCISIDIENILLIFLHFDEYSGMIGNTDTTVKIDIIIDTGVYSNVYRVCNSNSFKASYRLEIRSFQIKNKDMFSECVELSDFFKMHSNFNKYIPNKLSIDLSDYRFKPDTIITDLIKEPFAVKGLSKDLLKCNIKNLFCDVVFERDEFLKYLDFFRDVKECTIFNNTRVDKLYYSDYIRYDIANKVNKLTIEKLIIDTDITKCDTAPFFSGSGKSGRCNCVTAMWSIELRVLFSISTKLYQSITNLLDNPVIYRQNFKGDYDVLQSNISLRGLCSETMRDIEMYSIEQDIIRVGCDDEENVNKALETVKDDIFKSSEFKDLISKFRLLGECSSSNAPDDKTFEIYSSLSQEETRVFLFFLDIAVWRTRSGQAYRINRIEG